ncbi:CBASS cGAMP-activated phospholipase [Thiobacillus sp.]|uniref:CBASS cGAMP-activated phospholipase n=1 Tax=Thiobacillus sp. TaxID=924 RepID=UPI0025E81DF2|nr:CBASS cGAMP-activated phospholipase [Thiobacillus sp.]
MTGPLQGVRIWLSGAVPPDATEAQRASILAFVGQFAASVFRSGGHILHGSHPSFTPTLLAEADRFVKAEGRKDCLTLVVSRHWSKDAEAVPIQQWREHCTVYETPEASGDNARDESLGKMRHWMSERSDAFVAVGGRWWQEVAGRAGVPIEAGLAIHRGLPCFLLGGLGGAAQGFVRDHPELIDALRNGLDHRTNAAIATNKEVADLVDTVCTQLARLPLVHGRVSDGISFRILALDGGGIKGAFTASVLATLEKAIGEPVGQHFDLIAGTSTGGILAVGLGMGLTPLQMLEFYRKRGPVIFPVTRLLGKLRRELRHFVRPKHSQDVLLRELTAAYFPDGNPRALGDSICRLVVPAYDAISGACHTFRTPHHELLTVDAETGAAEVALATAAAPTYFSAARVKNMIANPSYFDGGVWANCPVMAGIVEAVCYLDVPLDRIDVLSIGTTDEPFTVSMLANAGIAGWNKTLIDLLMNAQVDSAIRHAQQLVGDPRFLRINATTTQGLYKLDDAKEIESLIALGNKTASDPSILYQVKSRFLNGITAMDWKV